MLIPIKARSSSKLGHVGSKIRLLGQILEKKPCVHSRGHSLEQKFMKLWQNVNSHKSRSSSKLVHVGSKARSLDQIMQKPCVFSRGHSFVQMFMKLCQNVNSQNLGQFRSIETEYMWQCRLKRGTVS